jgi:hypothetical protein
MRTAVLSFSCLALASSAALAQPSYVEERSRPRVGLELGIGLQAGEIGCNSSGDYCDGFTEAGGLNLNASYFLTPTFGLALDLWGMSHRDDDFTFNHYVNTLGVKWRPVRFLTLSAGVGAAHATVEYDGLFMADTSTEDAFAVMGAISVDLLRGRHWALSVEGRVGKGFYGDDNDNDNPDVVGQNHGLGAAFTFFGF